MYEAGYSSKDAILYDKKKILIGFSLLTSDYHMIKAKVIFDYLSTNASEYKEEGIGIDKVKFWISLYFNIACNSLPILANDFPAKNKTSYMKLFKEWNDNLRPAIDEATNKFMKIALRLRADDFNNACEENVYLFNVLTIRKYMNDFIQFKKKQIVDG
jgi:hypothetical protein